MASGGTGRPRLISHLARGRLGHVPDRVRVDGLAGQRDRALDAAGLVSAYHTFHKTDHGQERHATYRHQFKDSQAWHIDFCFIPTSWAKHLVDVRPLDGNEWEGRSDHFPLRVELRF